MSAPLSGQLTVSASAQQLTSPVTVTAFELKAPIANQNTLWIGPAGVTATTGYPLEPGDRLGYERGDQHGQTRLSLTPSDIYAVGTGPDVLAWFGSP